MDESTASAVFRLTNAATAAVFVLLAVVVARRAARSRPLKLWTAFCVMGGAFAASLAAVESARTAAAAEMVVRAAMTFGCLALLLFFEFSLITLGGATKVRTALIGISRAWALVLIGLFWLTDAVVAGTTSSEFSRFAPVAGRAMPCYVSFLLFGWLTPLLMYVRAARRASGLKRTQAAYMLFAFGIGAVATSGTLLPSLLGSQTLLAISPALLFPLFPLTITYAIVRHRLWDIRTIAHRTAVWIVLSLGLLVPLYLVLRLAARFLPPLGEGELAVLLVALFLLAHLYLRAVQPRLDHLFQRRAYDRQRVRDRFTDAMARLNAPGEVAGQLLDTLAVTLYPERTEVLLRPDGETDWQRHGRREHGREVTPCPSPVAPSPFVTLLTGAPRAVERSEIRADPKLRFVAEEAERYFDRVGCEVCLPLVQGGELLGMVHLGPKELLKPYSQGDLELLEQLGVEASIGLSNAVLFERVDAQRRDLEDLTVNLEERVAARTTELEEANLKLATAYEGLKELDTAKSRFFANISHELRTPLTLILAPLESMLEGELGGFDEGQRHHLASIKRNALGLLKLIDELLDLSRLEESRLRLRVERVALDVLVSRLVETAESMAERKGIAVSLETRAGPVVEADPGRLETVLVNLLSNALKFTAPGGSVRLVVESKADRALVSVSDTGQGIGPEELARVFDRFYQGDQSITRQHGGAGIGLALAKELVQLHGGTITVESEPGRGSTFTVALPLGAEGISEERLDRRVERVPVSERRREADAGIPEWADKVTAGPEYRFLELESATERRLVPRERVGELGAPRLLVVEDNPDMLRYLHQVLAERYEVWPVQDGERAWALLLAEHHDLVVADVMMPGLSGLELCERIKGEPRTARTPVVFLTARGRTEHRIEGNEAGADAYLAKPFSPAELRAVIDRLLEDRSRAASEAARARAASMETLLAGIAHELRNSAHQVQAAHAAICELVEVAGSGAAAPADRLRALEQVSRKAVLRITAVVDALRLYALGGVRTPVDCDLDELVARQVEAVAGDRDVEAGRVAVRLETRSGAVVRAALEPLRQVVLNLVENAIHAVGGRGNVLVETAAAEGRASLRVRDDGPGMPPEVLDRVFEPFFTTKGPSGGTGLGLALVKRTVESLGGEVRMKSRRGVGTEVVVELPCSAARAEASSPEEVSHGG